MPEITSPFKTTDEFIDYIIHRIEGYQIMGKYITEENGRDNLSPTGFSATIEEQNQPVIPVEWMKFCAKEIKGDLNSGIIK